MNVTRLLHRLVIDSRSINLTSLSKIYTCHVNYEFRRIDHHGLGSSVESSLWFTTIPRKAKKPPGGRRRVKPSIPKNREVLISCKDPKLNHHKGQFYGKRETIPLASLGWKNRRHMGDHFTILPTTEHPAFLISKTEMYSMPTSFEELKVKAEIIDQLKKLKVEVPTTIQAKTIPAILQGQNTVIAAETGCGKTLAYLVPMIQHVLNWKPLVKPLPNTPIGVVVLPSRELAVQVGMLTTRLSSDLGIKTAIYLGGNAKRLMTNCTLDDVDIVIGTIGVLCKFTANRLLLTKNCRQLVVDEADTLMDDSFNDKLVSFLKRFNIAFRAREHLRSADPTTQLCFSSATMPTGMPEKLSQIVSVESLVKISTEYLHKVQPHLPQKFIRLSKSKRPEELLKIAKKDVAENRPLMIFSNETATSNWIAHFLNGNGIKCIRANGSMDNEERLSQYQEFRLGYVDVISSTDLSSRGLDTTRVKHVLNYDFPRYMADYVHRCGRTGRLNHDEKCFVTNFVCRKSEVELVQQIETAARLQKELPNVNNNITRIISSEIERRTESL